MGEGIERFQITNIPISELSKESKKYVKEYVETIKDFLAEDSNYLKGEKGNIPVLYHLVTSQMLMLKNNVMNFIHQYSGKSLVSTDGKYR